MCWRCAGSSASSAAAAAQSVNQVDWPNVGNDAGGIATYASAGASYGYGLLWAMVLVTLFVGVVQEMSARMGAVTGKGFSDLVRETFTLRQTALILLTLLVANTGIIVSEFIGIAAATQRGSVGRLMTASSVEAAITILAVGSTTYVLMWAWNMPSAMTYGLAALALGLCASASAAPAVHEGDDAARQVAARGRAVGDATPRVRGRLSEPEIADAVDHRVGGDVRVAEEGHRHVEAGEDLPGVNVREDVGVLVQRRAVTDGNPLLDLQRPLRQLADVAQVGGRQPARLRVLLADMVAAHEGPSARQGHLRAMSERGPRLTLPGLKLPVRTNR